MHRITKVEPRPNRKVWLLYEDGRAGEVDFASLIDRGGVFTKLAESKFFERVRVGESGRFLEWPDGIDFCADALRQRIARNAAATSSQSKPRPKTAKGTA